MRINAKIVQGLGEHIFRRAAEYLLVVLKPWMEPATSRSAASL
jgi:hypothetical protein